MAKKKKVETPKTPPRSAGEVVLRETMDAITPEICRSYCDLMFNPKDATKKMRDETCKAVLHFAAVGWAAYHYVKNRGGETP